LRFGLTADLQTYFDHADGTTVHQAQVKSGTSLQAEDWSLASLTIKWVQDAVDPSSSASVGALWINTTKSAEATWAHVFSDSPAYSHLIGGEANTANSVTSYANFYQGFLYQFCALNYAQDDFTSDVFQPTCDGDFCSDCPGDSTCLIDCAFD
jgi:hypothetical protein